MSPCSTRYQTGGFCMLGTPHTKAHCTRAKVPCMHIGGVVQERICEGPRLHVTGLRAPGLI